MLKRPTILLLLAAAIVLIFALSIVEWTNGALRPFADVLQWMVAAGLLLLAREIVQRLNKSESKLRALVGSLDELILILDKDGRYVEIPSTNRTLLYKPLDQLIGRRVHDVFPQDIADVFVREIHRALASVQPTNVDYALPINDETVWFNAAVTRLSESTVLWVARDITARKAAEIELEHRVWERTKELRQSEERFRLAMQATSEAMWDLDLVTGKSWHSEGYRAFGYEEGFVENGMQWWKERLHPEDADRIVASRDEAGQSGEPSWSSEYRFRKADGTFAHVLQHALILRDARKKPIRVVGAMLDMTERKQLVDQLEQAKRVSSLGRVAASIAHEFNNILMGIQPNVEAIQRSSPTGLRSMTENIMHAVQRGKRVTDEILRFTRPAEPTVQCVDVPEFFAKWREDVEPLLGPGVETIFEVPEAVHVSADPMQLAQIFTNLAFNASDAMEDRGGHLTISAHLSNSFGSFPFGVVKSPDRFVHFVVKDEGCGISTDRLTHIFEPLFTTKRAGIGLGLAIIYQIVARHGGHIFVESEVGSGSMFHVFLPAALPEIAEPAAKEEAKAASIQKLVLIEDEPAVASGIAMLLEMDGIDVCTVHTGRDSIPAIEEFRPDAVILDIGLPDMDGVGVYLEIQQRWPELAVLFSSGHGDSAKLEAYLARPNVGFILKPYEFDAMRAALGRLVEQRPAVQA